VVRQVRHLLDACRRMVITIRQASKIHPA
jgi:hypothetical protein